MLARTFLRLSALEALRPSSLLTVDDPVWPTLARSYVYDSKVDPINEFADDEARIVAVVFTEGDDHLRIAQTGPYFYSSLVDLVIEIAAVARVRMPDGDYVAGLAVSDAELEADLDVLEQQIWWRLHIDPSGASFRSLVHLPFDQWYSEARRSAEEGQRLAARTIRIKVKMRDQCFVASPDAPLTGFARLPKPLREVAEKLGASTYLHAIASAVADVVPVSPVLPRLNKVSIDIGADHAASANESVGTVPAVANNLDG